MMRRLAWCDTNRSRSAGVEAVSLQEPARDLFGLPDGELEDRLAILLHVVQPLLDGLVRRRAAAATGRHAQRRPAAAVDLVLEVEDGRRLRSPPPTRRHAPAPSPNSTQVARSL